MVSISGTPDVQRLGQRSACLPFVQDSKHIANGLDHTSSRVHQVCIRIFAERRHHLRIISGSARSQCWLTIKRWGCMHKWIAAVHGDLRACNRNARHLLCV